MIQLFTALKDFYPSGLNLPVCLNKEIALQEAELFSSFIFHDGKHKIMDKCFLPCRQTGFTPALRYFHSNTWLTNSISDHDKQSTIFVSLKFKSFMVQEEIESYLYDTTSFMTAIGGNLGLFVGLSLLSLLLGVIKLARRLFQKVSVGFVVKIWI